MVIVYCEACGKRVPPAELNAGQAVQTGENLWLCGSCAAQNDGTLMPSTATMPAAQTPTNPPSSPNFRIKTGSNPSTGSTVRRTTKTTAYEAPKVKLKMVHYYIAGAAVAALALGAIIVGLSGSSSQPVAVAPAKEKEAPPKEMTAPKTSGSTETKAPTKTETVPTTPKAEATTTAEAVPAHPKQPSGGIISGDPKVLATTTPTPPLTAAERQKQMDKEMEEYRTNRAQRLLDDHKAWFKQNPNEAYAYKQRLNDVAGPYGSTPAGIEARKLIDEMKSVKPPPDRMDTIAPEVKEYQLVYDLNLAQLSKQFNYDADNRAQITQPFDRVAYILELDDKYIFVSMDAFTTEIGKIGIPLVGTGARFQQSVANMNVTTNVNGVISGNGINSGYIEFWSGNYGPNNGANVNGALNDKFDFGDAFSDPKDGYGCMQIHNAGQAQTLMAINNFGAGGAADLGIGNSPNGNPDWTFTGSGGGYRTKRLRVYVKLKP